MNIKHLSKGVQSKFLSMKATIHFHNIKKTNIGRMESEVGEGEEQVIK
jgi:hypothetical protein